MDNINKYKIYKNLYNKVCRRAKLDHTRQIYTEHKNDAKKLWSLINSSIGRKTKQGADIPIFFKENNIIFDNYKDIAEGFNNFFINIGQKLQTNLPVSNKSITDYLGNKVPSTFIFNFIDDKDIIEACSKLKPKTSQGLDFLSNTIIKQLSPKIPQVISRLINLSFNKGFVKI